MSDEFVVTWSKSHDCEKATKLKKIFHLFLRLISNVKTSGRFFQIFQAFSENLNFTNLNATSRRIWSNYVKLLRHKAKSCQVI